MFVGSEDGFQTARAALRLRGMGDLFGAQQSGEPTFRIADPLKDESLFAIARAAAEEILASDPDLRRRENAPLRAALGERYQRAMELFRVG